MIRALDEYEVAGVPTTIAFCSFVMKHDAFRSGAFSTHFVDDHFSPDALVPQDEALEEAVAMAATLYVDGHRHAKPQAGGSSSTGESGSGYSPWRTRRGGRDER